MQIFTLKFRNIKENAFKRILKLEAISGIFFVVTTSSTCGYYCIAILSRTLISNCR